MSDCQHKNTHPGFCDDCGALWCWVCRTHHAGPLKPYECVEKLRSRADAAEAMKVAEAEIDRLETLVCELVGIIEGVHTDITGRGVSRLVVEGTDTRMPAEASDRIVAALRGALADLLNPQPNPTPTGPISTDISED